MPFYLPKAIVIVPVLICFFLLGLTFDQMGYQSLSFLALGAAISSIIIAPVQVSLLIVLVFIWFQGFFKIVSNYHPFIHVGADAVVIVLLLKVLFKSGSRHKSTPPLTWLFALHFAWIFIVMFNPYSLSLVSNIAGAKVYISMFLLYFFGYYFINSLKDIKKLFTVFIALSAVQTFFTIYQGLKGPSSVLSLHPGYKQALAKLGTYAFRPFGMTNLPGGPSVYIYMVLPFLVYFIYSTRSNWVRLFSAILMPLVGVALFFCQVRSAIGKALIAVAFFIFSVATSNIPINLSRRALYLAGATSLGGVTIFIMVFILGYSTQTYEDNERALERSLSTFDFDSMTVARRGNLDRFIAYASEVPFGAGFSRVGAAAGAFPELQKNDPHFSSQYFFSDNLFVLLVIEIGLPGFFIVTALILAILYIGFKIWRTEKRLDFIGPQMAILSSLIAIFLGSYGAEGIVYNPESCFFWLFSGALMATREPEFNYKS